MTCRRCALGLLVLVLIGARPALAASSEAEKQARRSFERAEANFKAGLFAEALAQYRAGYDQLPLPGFLINMAQCQRRMGDLVQARTTYRKFLMVAPDSPYVAEVKALIAELDKLVEASEAGAASAAGPAAGASALTPPPLGERPLPAAASPVAASADGLVQAPVRPTAVATTGTRWWLWGTAGAVLVAGAVVAAYALKSPGTTTLHEGSLGTLRR
jgi:hypothetical protein